MSLPDSGIHQNISGSGNIFTGTGDVFVVQKSQSPGDPQVQSNLRILLQKVRTFWIEGVLEKSIHHAVLINLDKEVRPDSVEHPWGMVLELPDNERQILPPKTDILATFDRSARALLILGEPGSGKTTTLLDLARKLIEHAEGDISAEPVPVVFNLSSWGKSKSLLDWLVKELAEKYQISKKIGKAWFEQNRLLPLLDGFDEIAEPYRLDCIRAINEFIGTYGLPGLVVCSRIDEYTRLPARLRLNAAICIQSLTDKQINQYLKAVTGKDGTLKDLLKQDDLLYSLAKTPLFLSILSLAHRSSPEDLKQLSASSTGEYIQKIFDIYFERVLRRKGSQSTYSPEQVQKRLSWLARKMAEKSQSVFYIEDLQPSWLSLAKEQLSYLVLSRALTWFCLIFFGFLGFTSLATAYQLALAGALLSLWSPFLVLLDWPQIPVHTATRAVRRSIPRSLPVRLPGWGRFVYFQLVVLTAWFFVLMSPEIPALNRLWTEPDAWLREAGLLTVVLLLLAWAVLQLLFMFVLWKFPHLLKHILKNASLGFALLVPFLGGPELTSPWWGPVISGVLLLGIWWVSKPVFAIVRAGLPLVAVLFLMVFAVWDRELLDPLVFSFALFLFPACVGLVATLVKAARGLDRDLLNEIRLTENLSWSWKKSAPLALLSAFLLLCFFFTSRMMNQVTLRDSRSGALISTLQKSPNVHWTAFPSSDGHRIVLLGQGLFTTHSYLYDSLHGEMIADLGTQQDSAYAYGIFNQTGSRLIVGDLGYCSPGCTTSLQLRDGETGSLVAQLAVERGMMRDDDTFVQFDYAGFVGDDLVFQPVRYYDPIVTDPRDGGGIIWHVGTGTPLLSFYHDHAVDRAYIRYLPAVGDKGFLELDMSQIGSLKIYDDHWLKQRPILLANQSPAGAQMPCSWYALSQQIKCPAPEPITGDFSAINFFQSDVRSNFYGMTQPDPYSTAVFYTAGRWELGTRYEEYQGVRFPFNVYPNSTVQLLGVPGQPRFLTITDGNNVAAYVFGFLSVLVLILLFIRGLSTGTVERKTVPNQGILLTLQNSLILGLLMAGVFGLLTYIFSVLFLDGTQVKVTTIGLGVLAGTIVWLFYGGMDVVLHYTLRLILALRGYLPWKLVPFLDYCADNLLLQKVGGGYIFIHRMLLENLAKKYQGG